MKKILCVFLSVLMLASLGLSAFAQNMNEEWYDVDCSNAGVTLVVPSGLFFDVNGTVDVLGADEMGYKSGVYIAYLGYIDVSQDDYYEGNYEAEDIAPLLLIVGLKDNYDSTALDKISMEASFNRATQIGNTDGVTYYAIIGADARPAFESPYAEEYDAFLQRMPEVIENSYFYAPVDPYAAQAGTSAAFETIDLNGNTVNSADLFSQNEITMVNLWATWCPHCCEELPDLAQIHQQLQGIGCGIVGLLEDDSDAETLAQAQELLNDAGVTYPCIVAPENADDIFPSNGLPCSYFVNRNGEIVGTPVQGKQVDKYYEAVQDLLNGGVASDIVTDAPGSVPAAPVYDAAAIPGFGTTMGAVNVSGAKAGIAPASGTEYRVLCVDEAGNPVAGAAVQFCSDITCSMAKTDENGVAVFDADPGIYSVHLLKPPAGFAKDETEYKTPSTYGDITIVLKAA